MPAGFAGNFKLRCTRVSREVSYLVLMKTVLTCEFRQCLKHVTRQIFLHIEFTRLQLLIQRRVLFINHLVTGKVFWLQLNRFTQ